MRMRGFRGIMAVRAWRVWLVAICWRMRRDCCRGRCLRALVLRSGEALFVIGFYEFGLGCGGMGWLRRGGTRCSHWVVL